MKTVACVGIAVIDMLFTVADLPVGDGKYYATDFQEIGGGVAANAAVAISRLGGNARYIGRVGEDQLGTQIVDGLEAAGVDTGGVRTVAGVTSPVSAVMVDSAGDRTIVNYTPPRMYEGGDLTPATNVSGVDAVLVDVRWPDGAAAALAAAATAGIPSIFDFDRPMDSGGVALAAAASHVAFSSDALAATSGIEDPETGLARVAESTDAWLAVTLGADGVCWREGGVAHHLPAFDVDVVDTVGAGDVFHGALALAIAEGRPEADAVLFAAAAAALKCTRPGARAGSPSREEVEKLIREAS